MLNLALGIDIGGTNTKIGLIHPDGHVIEHLKMETKAEEPFTIFLDRLEEQVKILTSNHPEPIAGIGIGAPCASRMTGQIENAPNLKNWGRLPIRQLVKDRFHLPVFLDNDANISAIGEGKWGEAQSLKNFIVLTLGTGVGTGIVVNGQILAGTSGLAGEGGHIIMYPQGRPCGCGGVGHLEAYCSVRGIKQTYKELFNEETGFREMSAKYANKEEKAMKCVDVTANHLGLGLATMSSLFLPDLFVLAGGVSALGNDFCQLVEKYLNHHVFPSFKYKSKVKISSISTSDGAILGAASLVFTSLETV